MYLQPQSDAYGLLMHTNGKWEWTLAPGVSPSPRYQHAAVSELVGMCHPYFLICLVMKENARGSCFIAIRSVIYTKVGCLKHCPLAVLLGKFAYWLVNCWAVICIFYQG